jgi:hypothetical protein
MPDDVALMTPQRAMGRQIGRAFRAWPCLRRRWRRRRIAPTRQRVNATHPIFPRRRARAGQPAKP